MVRWTIYKYSKHSTANKSFRIIPIAKSGLKQHGIKISMCNEAWQNAYTERINRTIKHEYLRHRKIDCLHTLRKEMKRAIKLLAVSFLRKPALLPASYHSKHLLADSFISLHKFY